MKPYFLKEATQVAIETALKAGSIQKQYFGKENTVKIKDRLDIVSEVDLMCEDAIINKIQKNFPSHLINSEEQNLHVEKERNDMDWNWIIDPIDGTINYVNNFPFFAVSIALTYQGITQLGIIFNPILNQMYTSQINKGAFLNDRPIKCSKVKKLKNSLLSFMLTSHYNENENNEILKIIEKFSPKVRGLRLLVSQSMELSFIASGVLQGTICIKSSGYSSAAGSLLVKEAGGKVTDLNGNDHTTNSKSIVASNNFVHDQIINIIHN